MSKNWRNCSVNKHTYLDITFGFLKSMLVCDAFQLVSLLYQSCVLHLDLSLLVHDFGDFFAHAFRHFFTNIILKLFKVFQLFIHLRENQRTNMIRIGQFIVTKQLTSSRTILILYASSAVILLMAIKKLLCQKCFWRFLPLSKFIIKLINY